MPARKTATKKAAKKAAKKRARRVTIPFVHKLVLNKWMLSLFGVEQFKHIAEHLKDEQLEGMDENNIHKFYHELYTWFPELPELPKELLLEYDQNIVRHTLRLNDRRITRGEAPIVWKYFQYLTLLFVEIYLDRYFNDANKLLADLNNQIDRYNSSVPEAEQLEPFKADADAWPQLNKLALWNATGSGKTLLMHVNILQFQHYLDKHQRRRELNRIILLTPNQGLSLQHLKEFEEAGIQAELFDKNGRGLFTGHSVEIIDIHKLKDEMGDKTVAIDAFESNNLVLIDEGHRGASGGETGTWMRLRNALCEKGFSFEYSATFGQAVKGDPGMTRMYARSVLMDYSYRYFYGDGFGKDYQILNIDAEIEDAHRELYLVACLLAFFQQQRLFREQKAAFIPFQIENPLWVFVGGSVTASLSAKEASDIVEIVRFLARYAQDRAGSVQRIENVLNQGIVAVDGRNIFAQRFAYLNSLGLSAQQVFEETLKTLFNATGGGSLYVENLKGATGEIALKLGDNDPFGVINVGDDAKLCKLCEDYPELEVSEREFSGSLFHAINDSNSPVNLLIGSKKFTEGWNSWRVSTMGLMNIGKTEGSQIIQLFGRGVRLRGYNRSLKRSGRVRLPESVERHRHIGVLETLNIFGVKADYMAQFKEFLEEEGLPPNEEMIEFILPVIRNLGSQKLRTVRLKKVINGVNAEYGDAFKRIGPVPTLAKPDASNRVEAKQLQESAVTLNWYPKIKALKSGGVQGGDAEATPFQGMLTERHVAFMNKDKLFFELERFKAERAWFNLNLSRDRITELLEDTSWYRLYIPKEELVLDSFEKVMLWEDIALALLKKYTERYYTFRKREWELPHLEYQELAHDDPNFPDADDENPDGYYRILIEQSREDIVTKLEELKRNIESRNLAPWEFQSMKAIWFDRHLYEPLMHMSDKLVEISPAPLNQGERRFVEDMKTFHDDTGAFFEGKELYLLRNMSRGRGVGFFEAGNFHPDFIVWLVDGDKQYINFVDPKGIRNLGWQDPKIDFYATIKEIEERLGDENSILNSFIVSNTPSSTMRMLWGVDKAAMEAKHILFQQEDQHSYVSKMLEMAQEQVQA